MDILLDLELHDAVFINGECPVTRDRAESIQQRLKIKLLTFYGEWFLNTEYGVPYFQEIFGKQRNKATVDSIFQKKILEEEGVIRIVDFESTLTTDRVYYLAFNVQVDDGTTTDTIVIASNT